MQQRQMAKIVFAQTNSPTILGTMNDFDRMLDPAAGQSLTSAALELAEAPCGPIAMESPNRATVNLFASPHFDSGLIQFPWKPVGYQKCRPAQTPVVHEALTEARTVEVGKQKTRVFSAEHAVAVALQTNRATDRLKIEHLLESGREPLDEARLEAILKAHGLEDRWKKFLETRR